MAIKIAITGEARSGKDTVCEYLKEQIPTLYELYFATGIKMIVDTFFPEAYKDGKPRKHYQVVGQSLRQLNQDVWINKLERGYKAMTENYGVTDFIITDLRQSNEYKWAKENGFEVIKVVSDEDIRKQRMADAGDIVTDEDLTHETEQAIKLIPFDYKIVNNGTMEELKSDVDYLAKVILMAKGAIGTGGNS